MHKRDNRKSEVARIASERIDELFRQAEIKFKEEPKLSDRYVELARKISMKCKVKIPRELKRRFCKNCHKFLVPGANLRVRIQGKKVVYHCNSCNNYMRYSLHN
ncbi:MAG: ribonuclease P protein component 4 [archaeon]